MSGNIFFLHHLKMQTPFLSHGLYKKIGSRLLLAHKPQFANLCSGRCCCKDASSTYIIIGERVNFRSLLSIINTFHKILSVTRPGGQRGKMKTRYQYGIPASVTKPRQLRCVDRNCSGWHCCRHTWEAMACLAHLVFMLKCIDFLISSFFEHFNHCVKLSVIFFFLSW